MPAVVTVSSTCLVVGCCRAARSAADSSGCACMALTWECRWLDLHAEHHRHHGGRRGHGTDARHGPAAPGRAYVMDTTSASRSPAASNLNRSSRPCRHVEFPGRPGGPMRADGAVQLAGDPVPQPGRRRAARVGQQAGHLVVLGHLGGALHALLQVVFDHGRRLGVDGIEGVHAEEILDLLVLRLRGSAVIVPLLPVDAPLGQIDPQVAQTGPDPALHRSLGFLRNIWATSR